MTNWRPREWDKCRDDFSGFIGGGVAENKAALEDFEAGADALLEKLFKLAEESPTGTFTIDSKKVTIYEELDVRNKDI